MNLTDRTFNQSPSKTLFKGSSYFQHHLWDVAHSLPSNYATFVYLTEKCYRHRLKTCWKRHHAVIAPLSSVFVKMFQCKIKSVYFSCFFCSWFLSISSTLWTKRKACRNALFYGEWPFIVRTIRASACGQCLCHILKHLQLTSSTDDEGREKKTNVFVIFVFKVTSLPCGWMSFCTQ